MNFTKQANSILLESAKDMQSFDRAAELLSRIDSIGIIPGSFKPPHIGHYNLVRHALTEIGNDVVVIFMSPQGRDDVEENIARDVWDAYDLSDRIMFVNLPQLAKTSSPVYATFAMVNKLNEINAEKNTVANEITLYSGTKREYDIWIKPVLDPNSKQFWKNKWAYIKNVNGSYKTTPPPESVSRVKSHIKFADMFDKAKDDKVSSSDIRKLITILKQLEPDSADYKLVKRALLDVIPAGKEQAFLDVFSL